MFVPVSGAGLAALATTPLRQNTLLSLAETASCAQALLASGMRAAASRMARGLRDMGSSRSQVDIVTAPFEPRLRRRGSCPAC